MEKKNFLTKVLTITGVALAWFPLLAPVLLLAASVFTERMFRFDYLMPAELFPLVFLGGVLLLWAAFRVHKWQRFLGWSFGLTIGLLVGSQAIAVITGLASGATEPVGWRRTLVLGMLVGYILAVMAIGIGGGLLLRDLFRPSLRMR